MITLYQPPPAWGLPSISPFCVKLETYLRMAKIPYQVKPPSFTKAPKGKIPYIKHDGRYIGDSGFIIEHLRTTLGDPLDKALSPETKALGHALNRMIEESLYFSVAYLRWTSPEAWPHVDRYFRSLFPPLMRPFMPKMIRKQMLKTCYRQGIARHTREEVQHHARADVTAISRLLGNNKYIVGDQPTSFDATAYGFLVNAFGLPWMSEENDVVRGLGNIEPYVKRMRDQYWS